jgi:acylaminoacyl-peptidase
MRVFPSRPLALAILLLGASLPLRGQDRRLAAADLFQLEYAADPQISPDGQWVAYVRQWSDPMSVRRFSNVWLVKSDGSSHRPRTTGKFTDDAPRWSPDGKRLAYLSNRTGGAQLYVRWMDTGESYALTNGANPPSAPRS